MREASFEDHQKGPVRKGDRLLIGAYGDRVRLTCNVPESLTKLIAKFNRAVISGKAPRLIGAITFKWLGRSARGNFPHCPDLSQG
jgi:hypothetical protein